MHDGMQYDPIQGQGHGDEPLKVGNSAIFKMLSPPSFVMGAGRFLDGFLNSGTITAYRAGFLIFVLVFFCHVTLKLAVSRSQPSVLYGANLLMSSYNNGAIKCTTHCKRNRYAKMIGATNLSSQLECMQVIICPAYTSVKKFMWLLRQHIQHCDSVKV